MLKKISCYPTTDRFLGAGGLDLGGLFRGEFFLDHS